MSEHETERPEFDNSALERLRELLEYVAYTENVAEGTPFDGPLESQEDFDREHIARTKAVTDRLSAAAQQLTTLREDLLFKRVELPRIIEVTTFTATRTVTAS